MIERGPMRLILPFALSLLTALIALPAAATDATCRGTNLVDVLPEAERQSLEARADAVRFGKGLLWQAQRGDLRLTLFGTYHFRHHLTAAHLAALAPRLEVSDLLVLEVSGADMRDMERRMSSDPSLLFLTEGPTLVTLLGDDWPRLKDELSERRVPGIMAAKFKPIWASMLLGIGPCEARRGAMEKPGIDDDLATLAAELGVPDMSIESPMRLLALMDDAPMQDQIDLLRLSLAWAGRADDMQYTLLQEYLEGNVALIWEFTRHITEAMNDPAIMDDFAEFEDALLIGRNRDWIDVLDILPDGDILVAVGAAHLPGDEGVLALLQARGFAITPLPFDP